MPATGAYKPVARLYELPTARLAEPATPAGRQTSNVHRRNIDTLAE